MAQKKKRRPLILVTNDDGITAPGLHALAETMKQLGEIVVVAPDSPQSGMGHAITLNHPLRLEHVEIPYEGTSLPGIIVHADRQPGQKGPIMLFLDGFDVTKEIQYFRGVPEIVKRGVSVSSAISNGGVYGSLMFGDSAVRSGYVLLAMLKTNYLRNALFAKLQRLPVAFHDRNPIGRLMTRVTNDVDALNDLFASGVVAMLNDFVLLYYLINYRRDIPSCFLLYYCSAHKLTDTKMEA